MRPACSSATVASASAIGTHGPHRSAQKSTTTGTSAEAISSSNEADVSGWTASWVVAMAGPYGRDHGPGSSAAGIGGE